MRSQPSMKPPVFDMEELSSLLAFAKLRLRDALRIQPLRDALTGLYTRRFMNELLKRQVHRAARSRRPFALIFFDLDNFQHFNGTYGHVAGDVVLRELAKLFRNIVQPGDSPCRIAGDEFVIILPDASMEAVVLRAQELKEEFAKLRIPYEGENLQPPTLTTGVAAYPESGSTPESLLDVAEEAMYEAKSHRVRLLL